MNRKGITYVADCNHLVVGRNNGDPKKVGIDMGEIGYVVSILTSGIATKLLICFGNDRFHPLGTGSDRAGIFRLCGDGADTHTTDKKICLPNQALKPGINPEHLLPPALPFVDFVYS